MIIENIKRTRSHRKFGEKKIEESEILKIIEVARFTSSSRNSQILRYSYSINEEECKKLFSGIVLGGYLKKEEKPTFEERPRAYILISTKRDEDLVDTSIYFNMGMVSQNIMLQAEELGYGACVVMAFNKKVVEEIFNLPKEYEAKGLIVLGQPKDTIEVIEAQNINETKYFIENGKHYVPKLKIEELILNKN